MISPKPSPPSLIGSKSSSSSDRTVLHPRAIASAACAAVSVPLNLSGMMRTFILRVVRAYRNDQKTPTIVNRFPSHAWTILLFVGLLFATPASAENWVQWATNYYAVSGSSLREIHQSIGESRPGKSKSTMDGLTQWHINWRFSLASSGENVDARLSPAPPLLQLRSRAGSRQRTRLNR